MRFHHLPQSGRVGDVLAMDVYLTNESVMDIEYTVPESYHSHSFAAAVLPGTVLPPSSPDTGFHGGVRLGCNEEHRKRFQQGQSSSFSPRRASRPLLSGLNTCSSTAHEWPRPRKMACSPERPLSASSLAYYWEIKCCSIPQLISSSSIIRMVFISDAHADN